MLLQISTSSSNWNVRYTDVSSVEKFLWTIVYHVGLALGEVKISMHSKPNLMTEVKFLEAAIVNFCSDV